MPCLKTRGSNPVRASIDVRASTHRIYYIWRYSLGSPRLLYALRTSPTVDFLDELQAFNDVTRDIPSEVLNVDFINISWQIGIHQRRGSRYESINRASAHVLCQIGFRVQSLKDLAKRLEPNTKNIRECEYLRPLFPLVV